jgi:tetrahydromethanopterin S-methyltransferase subunit F
VIIVDCSLTSVDQAFWVTAIVGVFERENAIDSGFKSERKLGCVMGFASKAMNAKHRIGCFLSFVGSLPLFDYITAVEVIAEDVEESLDLVGANSFLFLRIEVIDYTSFEDSLDVPAVNLASRSPFEQKAALDSYT